jgi:outer membrane scaffolding protein for murein synthesis (MipA/OmpV family)
MPPHASRALRAPLSLCLAAATALTAVPATAQDEGETTGKRTRVFAGPQFWPETPGSKKLVLGPFVDLSRAKPGEDFAFEAPDQSFGFDLVDDKKFDFGPTASIIRKRKPEAVGGNLPKVGLTVEAGAFAQAWLTPALRVRAEARKGLGGHGGWVGDVGADYVARQGDDWLFSIGPRVSLGDSKYSRAYFGVAPADVAASGLPAYDPKGGVQSVGVTAGYMRQLTRNWGVAAFARYDRLVGDAADSPVTRAFGSRNQPAFGIALSYTFGGKR